MKKITMVLMLVSVTAFSQDDAEGCKDHAMFTRLPNYVIESCSQNFTAVEFQMTETKNESIEGNVINLRYAFKDGDGAKMPSPLQIIKNYEAAILKNSGKRVYFGVDNIGGGEKGATFTMALNGNQYWVRVSDMYAPLKSEEIGAYSVIVLEKSAMKQEISANEIFDALNKDGFIALYINFETGKTEIKPESQAIVEQIQQMLKSNSGLKVSIEGHTDNVGVAASNKVLSENRAKSVVTSLVSSGIDKTRLTSKGWGQEKPIADNRSEDGKAKNRRVEIVKQ